MVARYALEIGLPMVLLVVGYAVGRALEAKHFRSLGERERRNAQLPIIGLREPIGDPVIGRAGMVMGSAVISIDYFKRFLSALRGIFGGPVRAYESLLDRARREAVQRMIAAAPGATQIINVRIETSAINGSDHAVGTVEALAWGTAIYPPGETVARSGPTQYAG